MNEEKKNNYVSHISPWIGIVFVVVDFCLLQSSKDEWRGIESSIQPDPSFWFYFKYYSITIVSIAVAIIMIVDVFRNAGDNPWYIKYIVIPLSVLTFALLVAP